MRKWLILLSALSATASSAAPAWTWVDANGVVHYSDRPVPGARQIDLPGAQAISGSTAPATARAATRPSPSQQPGATAPYRTIEILSPTEQQTLSNIAGNLPVRVAFEPGLQPGHRFDLSLDGQRRNLNTTSAQLTLTDVFRGTHTLQVIVIDTAGAEVMRSPPRNFVVLQVSTQNPNSPQAAPPQSRPPPPRPQPQGNAPN